MSREADPAAQHRLTDGDLRATPYPLMRAAMDAGPVRRAGRG